jgi:ribonucleoside-diphosphate reductase alpha chain
MKIERRFTKTGESPYQTIPFSTRSSEIRNPDGSTVFHQDNIQAPDHWSQLAIDILAQKYFRKAGVPQYDNEGKPLFNEKSGPLLGGERDADRKSVV